MTSRLRTIAPGLVEHLEKLSADALRELARAAATHAVGATSLRDASVDAGLAVLGTDNDPERSVRAAVLSTVEQLDEAAWDTQDRVAEGLATEDQYLADFARARAASAVAFALAEDPLEAASEAVYESQAATGSLDDLLARIGQSDAVADRNAPLDQKFP